LSWNQVSRHVICYPKSAVRMIWWFLILSVSALVVVSVVIALYMRLWRHWQASHAAQEGSVIRADSKRQ
jgi:cytochrome c biogenesis protein ResB